MPPRTRVAKLTRVTGPEGQTLYFQTPALRRVGNHGLQFLEPRHVPPFEGPAAWFECECVRGGVRIVRVIQQVPGPD